MTTRQVIEQGERATTAHKYPDGTALYDILVGDKAYSVRVHTSVFNDLSPVAAKEGTL